MTTKNANGHSFNIHAITAFDFKPHMRDPVTTKPLVYVSGLVDPDGNAIPAFWVTCNVLLSMAEGAKLALEIWEEQGK